MNILDAVLHWVPICDGNAVPKLSFKKAYKINDNFWIKKITESLSRQDTQKIEDIPNTPSTVIQNLRLMVTCTTEKDFLKYSYVITDELHKAQTKANISEGFLLFFKGQTGNRTYIAMLKLEGMRGSEASFDKNRQSFDILPIESILLTDKSRVFKMAYFEFHNGSLMRAEAMDDQVNRYEISTFWLVRFLGCRLPRKPETLTQDFFDFARAFARNRRLSPTESLNVSLALFVEMNSNAKTISVAGFAKNHIPGPLITEYNNAAQKAGLPMQPFAKIIGPNLSKQITVRRFLLEEEIQVLIPQAALNAGRTAALSATSKGQKLSIISPIIKELT